MKLIYQIGRLDAQMRPLRFMYKGQEYESELSSLSLKKYFKNSAMVILIYPVSLPFNKTLIQEKSLLDFELKKEIENVLKNSENFLINPFEFFDKHPHSKKADCFILIHSIGEYENIKFKGTYNDIVLEIFFDMIKRYFEGFSEIYIDISSGLNIYVSAMLEAARHFFTFVKLIHWNNKSFKIYNIFTDPIIGSSAGFFNIYIEEIQFKVFFSSPLSIEDIHNYSLSRKIAYQDRKLKQEIQKYLENFALLFSSIKNAVPLGIYTFQKNTVEDIKSFILKIIDLKEKKLKINLQNSSNLPKDEILKVLLTLGFYSGIIEILNKNGIKINDRYEAISNLEIEEKFGDTEKSIYKIFSLDLNIKFVGNELRNLKEGKDEEGKKLKDKIPNDKWVLLKDYLPGGSADFNKRNFFAHAGFEKTITQVKKVNDILYFKYLENKKQEIRKILIEGI